MFNPYRRGARCRFLASCDGHWHRIGDALICQCTACRRVINVVTVAAPMLGIPPSALDALQAQASREPSDFPGCTE